MAGNKGLPPTARLGLAFRLAQGFIREKGLVKEFNDYCNEQRKLRNEKRRGKAE